MIGLAESHEQPAPFPLSEAVGRIFAPEGLLCRELGLEHRPQQEKMAREVAESLELDQPLLFEAGTGVGKSLAYLAPGIIHAVDAKRPFLVSTHTIALQEQIEGGDLPLCRRLFGTDPAFAAYAGFRAAVLLGKANYLCPNRLAQALASRQELFATQGWDELQRIADWAASTRDGLRHELSPPPSPEVWEWVSADSSTCSSRNCRAESCFYQRARARIRQAHVVIVNHSLLFALINADANPERAARGVLFPDDFLVIDEAHTVPEIASQHFGVHVSSFGFERLLKHLYNPERQRGLLQKYGNQADRRLVADASAAAGELFAFARESVVDRRPIVRVREESIWPSWDDVAIRALIQRIDGIASRFDDGIERDALLEQRDRLAAYHTHTRRFLSQAEEEHVHWVERTGRSGQTIIFRTCPLDVAAYLRESVFRRQTSVVLTSATLAVAGRMEPFKERVGADAERGVIVSSPFDFEENMRVFVAGDMPQPTAGEARLDVDWLADYIRFCAGGVKGGTLVLFTSYADMNRVAELVRDDFERARRPFYLQGGDYSRTEMARLFRGARNGILFGTDSFWTGIDIPGEALSQVIITRLPFEPPNHPLAEAKSEWIRDQGGNPFNALTLPDALIKFRQGVGRLIRSHNDRGCIVVLDSRILHKSYGRHFLDCLPNRGFVKLTRRNRESLFNPF